MTNLTAGVVMIGVCNIYSLHLFLLTGYPVVNDPLYNHTVFGPEKGRAGNIGKTDEQLIQVKKT
jgi:hypothetical protein